MRTLIGIFVKIRVTGKRHLPAKGPYLLICNHISHFDPPILASIRWGAVSWVVALEMFQHPVGRWFFEGLDSISINRQESDLKAVREILRRLKSGDIVGLFPEGGIRSGETSVLGGAPLDGSVGALAQLGGVPVVPCVVLGTDKLYAKRNWWWRTTLDFRFGPMIPLPSDPSLSTKEIREQVTRKAEAAMTELSRELKTEFALASDDFPKTAQERWAEAAAAEEAISK